MKLENDEEQIITGPILIPDLEIYRNDEIRGEHTVFFTAETIKELVITYLADNKQNNVTIEHSYNANNISLFESWIIEDPKNDKALSLGFTDLPKGTWMGSYKVNNSEVWEQIKNGELDGFSIEAFLSRFLTEMKDENVDKTVMKFLTQDKTDGEIISDLLDWLE